MKKIVSVLLVLLFVFSCFALAEKESDFLTAITLAKVVSEDGESSILYDLPGEYRNEIDKLDNGTFVDIIFEGTTWHKVVPTNGGKEGWMKASEISVSEDGYSALSSGTSVRGAKMVSSSDGVAALRWGPDTMYDKIDDLKNGTIVYFYETCGKWSRVLLEDGRVGYVYSSLLKRADMPEEWLYTVNGYVQVNGNSGVVRNAPNLSSKKIGYVRSGDVVEVYGFENYFLNVYVNGNINDFGYIHTDIISAGGLNRTLSECSVYYDNPYAYKCDVMDTLPKKTTVKVLANDGSCSRVQYNTNVIGYVKNNDLAYGAASK